MSTLVISDLHLGSRLRHDVLMQPEPLQRLLDALAGAERLVLLGDIVEMLEKRPERAMDDAEPILRRIGRALGAGREVIFVPGNHDRALVARWVRRVGAALTPDTRVPLDATPELARVASWLSPARIRVHYPGVWLGDRVWATHGHYLDRHLLPEAAFGVTRGLLGRVPPTGAVPIDYEQAGGPSLTRLEAFMIKTLPRPLAAATEDLAELIRASTMPLAPRRLLRPGMARLTARILGAQMRRASLPALSHVVGRLGVDADCVMFGHVHRLGPLQGDREARWQGPQGRPRLLNTGSWVYEPLLVHNATPPHPYWPGGAVILDDDQPPRAVGLLDSLPASEMHR
ncbi:MAG TPA: metallophosphoesterase [Solirubrobacteraceae bacterium]|nr:metallophosphoesterase [Solirubrobacteraceae bacterium]